MKESVRVSYNESTLRKDRIIAKLKSRGLIIGQRRFYFSHATYPNTEVEENEEIGSLEIIDFLCT